MFTLGFPKSSHATSPRASFLQDPGRDGGSRRRLRRDLRYVQLFRILVLRRHGRVLGLVPLPPRVLRGCRPGSLGPQFYSRMRTTEWRTRSKGNSNMWLHNNEEWQTRKYNSNGALGCGPRSQYPPFSILEKDAGRPKRQIPQYGVGKRHMCSRTHHVNQLFMHLSGWFPFPRKVPATATAKGCQPHQPPSLQLAHSAPSTISYFDAFWGARRVAILRCPPEILNFTFVHNVLRNNRAQLDRASTVPGNRACCQVRGERVRKDPSATLCRVRSPETVVEVANLRELTRDMWVDALSRGGEVEVETLLNTDTSKMNTYINDCRARKGYKRLDQPMDPGQRCDCKGFRNRSENTDMRKTEK